MSTPKTILAADIGELGLCVGTVEELADLARNEGIEELQTGRYKLIGGGVIRSYSDYVENEIA